MNSLICVPDTFRGFFMERNILDLSISFPRTISLATDSGPWLFDQVFKSHIHMHGEIQCRVRPSRVMPSCPDIGSIGVSMTAPRLGASCVTMSISSSAHNVYRVMWTTVGRRDPRDDMRRIHRVSARYRPHPVTNRISGQGMTPRLSQITMR